MFDFGSIARQYDDFYLTTLGKDIDEVEKRLVRQMLSSLPRKLSLEVGCGTGHWTEFFTSEGFSVVGIDMSEEMIEVAQAKNIKNAVCMVQDIQQTSFRNNYFANVFAITSLEFVEKVDKAITEIYRVLQPGGYLLIGALNHSSDYVQDKLLNSPDSSIAHSWPFTPESLRNLLMVFGEPQLRACAVIDDGRVLDKEEVFDEQYILHKGAFLVGLVQKNR